MALYTPFFERSMAVVGQGLKQREINELAQAAYLGDPQAMATLQGVAPDWRYKHLPPHKYQTW